MDIVQVTMPDIKTKSRNSANKVNSRHFVNGNHLKKDIVEHSTRASKFRGNHAAITDGPILRTGDQTGETGSQLTAENHTQHQPPDNNNQQTGKVHF